jgi:glycyl-tRNA synthetase
MAEIEHYVDPKNKSHRKFSFVQDLQLPLWTASLQDSNQAPTREYTLSSAVKAGIINNETLAYFLGRTYHFLMKIGISSEGIRFRQHRKTEMAHYASDCWDAEVETSYGWIEVAGHADRTCFDLSRHSQASGKDLVASKPLEKPVTVNLIRVSLNQKNLYSTFKDDKSQNQEIARIIENLSNEDKERLCSEFEKNKKISIMVGQKEISLSSDMISFERYSETQHEEKYTPGVIEPSFGMGRITYCVLEHCFRVREKDTKRTFFAFPPVVSPYKVSILPLIDDEEMRSFIEPIRRSLIMNGISYKVDDGTDSVGKRYARTDEIGIPFGITIDKDTIKDKTVTLREIVTMKQIRISVIYYLTLD